MSHLSEPGSQQDSVFPRRRYQQAPPDAHRSPGDAAPATVNNSNYIHLSILCRQDAKNARHKPRRFRARRGQAAKVCKRLLLLAKLGPSQANKWTYLGATGAGNCSRYRSPRNKHGASIYYGPTHVIEPSATPKSRDCLGWFFQIFLCKETGFRTLTESDVPLALPGAGVPAAISSVRDWPFASAMAG